MAMSPDDLNILNSYGSGQVAPPGADDESRDPSSIKPQAKVVKPLPLATALPLAQSPLQSAMVAQANTGAAAVQAARAAGVNRPGDIDKITDSNKNKNVVTDPNISNVAQVANAISNTAPFQQQQQGIEDLRNLMGLQAQRNAARTNVDLSPLAGFLDYQNKFRGINTNLAKDVAGQPQENDTVKEALDTQKRLNDYSRELVNTIRATHIGQTVTQDENGNIVVGGVQIPKPINNVAPQRLGLAGVQDLKKATDSAFKDNDEQLKAINTISQRVANSANNPAESGSIPALLEVMDTGSKRIMAGVLNMEGYDPSVKGQLSAGFSKMTQGMIPAEQRAFLQNRLQQAAIRAQQDRAARAADLHEYAKSLPINPSDVSNIVDSHYHMPEKGYPSASQAGQSNPQKMQQDFEAFKQMMKGAGQ